MNRQKTRIVVADDEPLIRHSLSELFSLEGFAVRTAESGEEALALLKEAPADIVITDMKMGGMDGIELLRRIKKERPETYVIMVTGYGSIENAVEAMQEGAYDYVTKPLLDEELCMIIGRIMDRKRLLAENDRLKQQLLLRQRDRFLDIVGRDDKMQKIYSLIEAISSTRSTVLVRGESGTGKHMIAHAIHMCNENERSKPFVEVSCGALSETLLESELFGHVKGAFTGAIRDKKGRFELADGGTIFLDEIDAFSPGLQVKLLRVLQEGELERVGESTTIKVDVRVIAASNQDLQELISQGKFRKDLYYRLNIITIELPPLRERKGDIPLLIQGFVEKHSRRAGKSVNGISDDAVSLLMAYNWPGNIRELENVIERAVVLTGGKVIGTDDLPEFFASKAGIVAQESTAPSLKEALRTPEKDIILKALDSVDWNRNNASRVLGINRTTLYKKMVRYGLLKNSRLPSRALPPEEQRQEIME
ncbi:MAG: sigma-54-dependent transcriptional regulator [Deltaproteobacteria bacterium]